MEKDKLKPSLLTGVGATEVRPLSRTTKALFVSGVLTFLFEEANRLTWNIEGIATPSTIVGSLLLLGAIAHAEWKSRNLNLSQAMKAMRGSLRFRDPGGN